MSLRKVFSRFGRQTPPTSGVTVPPGHAVHVYKATGVLGVHWSPGGVLVAGLGSSSDEFREELKQTSDAVDREFLGRSRAVVLATEAGILSDLFTPNDPKVRHMSGLLLWVLDSGSVPLWLRDPEPLLAALRNAANHGIPQLVLIHLVPRLTATVESLLAGVEPKLQPHAGIRALERALSGVAPVATIPQDDTFLVEVSRPEAVVCSVRTSPIPADEESAVSAPLQVVRAPRLRRLILGASDEDGWRSLCEELLSREISVHVVVDRQGRSAAMSWPVGEAIPAYPDVWSVRQAMTDLKLSEDRYSWGSFRPRELFEWVNEATPVGVALNAYKELSVPSYAYLPAEVVAELATGRVPKFPAIEGK